ncbi:uncharacterized protein LOC115606725 isoform X3 [Strigops habroptila]|nr:uncharacterized protein LOC115606725 isoform X3 [Strigops habroptila]XP_030338985.1 uncharacterized protein LOC115606725 isoform X3 [Strigops habroptila]XP_030338987.1 uncharacterized protein LOC115606725 isoform X3 [Strigops habroptila]XP_030338988.1 uncharacterized protein LOC115606725 isoform X3 [Strigops habroptila]XP_030338989.1 uncharacterized protein LOC115606725 isoform X3 [Strigops habroptila]XP_030338990.1 uncharacterized protein LOC115606725 isoform X3 [Strigops habroptila]XP_03
MLYFRCGFAGETGPRCIIPSEIKKPDVTKPVRVVQYNINTEELYSYLKESIHMLYFRCGFAGETGPRCIIPSEIKKPDVTKPVRVVQYNINTEELYSYLKESIHMLYFRCGFAGETGPRCIIPSEIKKPDVTKPVRVVQYNINTEELYSYLKESIHMLYFRCGFAGETGPRCIIPSEIKKPDVTKPVRVVQYNINTEELYSYLKESIHMLYFRFLSDVLSCELCKHGSVREDHFQCPEKKSCVVSRCCSSSKSRIACSWAAGSCTRCWKRLSGSALCKAGGTTISSGIFSLPKKKWLRRFSSKQQRRYRMMSSSRSRKCLLRQPDRGVVVRRCITTVFKV